MEAGKAAFDTRVPVCNDKDTLVTTLFDIMSDTTRYVDSCVTPVLPCVTPPQYLNIDWAARCETVKKPPLLYGRSDECDYAVARYYDTPYGAAV